MTDITDRAPTTDRPDAADPALTIIGIGSSAGGLEAIRLLVAALPPDAPVSYVVVQHMSPHHESLMTSLVSRDTNLEVTDVIDGEIPRRNAIYITPPKADVIFMDGKLRLVDPSSEAASPKPSVDRFFTSLAQEYGENTMGIILSGTGSDGAYGVQAIREQGGITIAQDTESAKYDGMPLSAVQTGCVDLILSPTEIGHHLTKILLEPRDFEGFRSTNLEDTPQSDLLQILLARTRVDFRDYKQSTIGRRIQRRMVALNIDSEEEYTEFCRHNPGAVDALFKDLLISVTRFFRDREAFDQLAAILPQLVERAADRQIRVWVAGCATGEEVYSIAMILCEALGCSLPEFKSRVQIFATDIDSDALQVARMGRYSATALNDIPHALASKYILRETEKVRVVEPLRAAILFSDHNVCQNPPFQRIDLLCCRNLLIYFGHTLQQKVMGRFHYAMRNEGLLFLGTAESVAGSDELFVQHRDAIHVFQKRTIRKMALQGYNMPNVSVMHRNALKSPVIENGPSTDRQLLQALAQSLGENSILVTDEYSIAQVFGDVSAYISMNNSSNLRMHIDLLRSPLREEARSLVSIALKNGKRRSGVRHLLAKEDKNRLRLDVYPIIAKEISERAALIVFTPIEPEEPPKVSGAAADADDAAAQARISVLENEVATTREALQQTIEELETSNEELQSLNEELQSTNEELQATNEELETSNEELQSTNEELITVNEELQVTTSELTGRTGELESVLSSSPMAILVADTAMQINQATEAAAALFGLNLPVNGPHISQCSLPDAFPSLSRSCGKAMQLGETVQHDFNSDGARVMLTCSPFFNSQGRVAGVTVVVTTFPGLASEMEMILSTDNIYLTHRGKRGEILRISQASADLLGTMPGDTRGKTLHDFIETEAAEEIIALDRTFLASGVQVTDEVHQIKVRKTGETRWLNQHKFRFKNAITDEDTIYAVGLDVTDVITARNEARTAFRQLEMLQEIAGVGYWTVDLEHETVHWSAEVHRIHHTDPENFVPDLPSSLNFYHPDDIEYVTAAVNQAIETGGEFSFTKRVIGADGVESQVQAHGVAIANADGVATRLVGVFRQVEAADGPKGGA